MRSNECLLVVYLIHILLNFGPALRGPPTYRLSVSVMSQAPYTEGFDSFLCLSLHCDRCRSASAK